MAFEGNRRLFLYQKLEAEGLLDSVPVVKFHGWKRISNEYGYAPSVRGRPFIEDNLDDIIYRFR